MTIVANKNRATSYKELGVSFACHATEFVYTIAQLVIDLVCIFFDNASHERESVYVCI